MRSAALFSLVCAANVAAQTPSTLLIGRVIDHGNGDAISGAAIKLSNGSSAVSDKRGLFTMSGLPEGRVAVTVEMLGYQTRQDSISIQPGRSHDIEIRLSTKPIQLPALAVTARSRWLEENGFYERRMSGLSPRVITAAELERRGRSTLTEVFGELPSVRVIKLGGNNGVRRVVRFMNSASSEGLRVGSGTVPGCEPALFIDGMRYRDRMMGGVGGVTIDSWDVIAPLAIEAIEIFRGGGAPMNYQDACGTVLIWTKRGG